MDSFPGALTATRSLLALAVESHLPMAVSIARPTPEDGFDLQPRCPVNHYAQEAVMIHAPDEAYRIWCPNCGYVMCEYLHGVARFFCRSCKWEGVIARHAASLVVSCTTIRRGAHETQWRKQPPRVVGDKPLV